MKIRKGGVTRYVSERMFKRKFKRLGFKKVEEEKEEVAEEKELSDYTVDELRDKAKKLELSGYYKLNKDELIAEIEKVK